MKKTVTIRYFALVGERRGTQTETYETAAESARALLHEIQASGVLPLTTNIAKAAINDEFVDWDAPIKDGDTVTLLSPFSGG
ncbi:MAG TPA: molybdopterin synthase sulfur carrier subunit [Myxococcales bacterium]|jgi:molybdopterin converting factor small subunit|nr:molybdopterin synthase sulfur carrier subunit [Myxococcales bacterium]